MKVLIFLGLIAALSAVRLTTHNYDSYEWVEPSGECDDHLSLSISNVDGKLEVNTDYGGYHNTCDDVLLDDRTDKCTLYASCKNRKQKYLFASLKLTGEAASACCKN